MILIGSRAARAWHPEFREPKDWDIIVSIPELSSWAERNKKHIRRLVPTSGHKYGAKLIDGTYIEFEILRPGSTQMLADVSGSFPDIEIPGGQAKIATPQLLWVTKRAHAIWPIRWVKTMDDMHWLRERAPDVTMEDWAYHDVRRAEHAERFKQRRINLAMSNEAFFAKSQKMVGRVVEHDLIHEVVKYGERPLYEKFKTDLTRASLNRSMFESASLQDRLRLVREEAMAIALERYVIPGIEKDRDLAYGRALQRICTTLTSGWFRDFAVDHWPFLRVPDQDFIALWQAAAPRILNRSISNA